DLQQMVAGEAFQRHHLVRRRNHFQATAVFGGGGADQRAVEAAASFQKIGEGQPRIEAELEGDVTELNIEIDEARLTVVRRFPGRELNGRLSQQRGRTDATDALDHADELANAN